MKKLVLAAALAACCAQPALAQEQNVVTRLTSLHFSGPDISSDEGPPRGWPRAGRPLSAPVKVSGENGDFLYLLAGLGGGNLVRAPVVPAQYTTVAAFQQSLLEQAKALYAADHERAAHLALSAYGNLVQRANGDLIGVLNVWANNTSQWSQGQPIPYRVIDAGLLFRMDFDGANPRLLASSRQAALLGASSNGVLVAAPDGSVYTLDDEGHGRLLRLTPDDQLEVMHVFEAPPAGLQGIPNGLSLGQDGRLYGVLAFDRGVPGAADTLTAADTPTGLIYSLDPAQPGSYRVLHRMTLGQGEFASTPGSLNNNRSFALDPRSFVVDGGDGWLYGTAAIGRCADVSTNVPTLDTPVQYASLCGFNLYLRGAGGFGLGMPPKPRYDVDFGNLYGTVFRVRKDGSGGYEVLHRFTGEDGMTPRGSLVLGKDGAIYGTTLAGGSNWSYDDQARRDDPLVQAEKRTGRQNNYLVSDGVFWRIWPARVGQAGNTAFEVVHHFAKAGAGKRPLGVQAAADGWIYGATGNGGGPWTSSTGDVYLDDNYGTVWSYGLAPSSVVTVTVAPAEIKPGETAELTWTSSGVKDCLASSLRGDWTGVQPEEGSITLTGKATGTYNYTLTCLDRESGAQVASPTVQLFVGAPASNVDENLHEYGNGGALAPAVLGLLGLLAWRRRPGASASPSHFSLKREQS